MDSTRVNTSLDLNINPFKHADEPPKREFDDDDDDFHGFGQEVSIEREPSFLVEELNRMSTENKKLTERLTLLCQNYQALQNHLTHLMNKNADTHKELVTPSSSSPKKRKADAEDIYSNTIGINDRHAESSCSGDEECCKRLKESIKMKISRVCYRTGASDANLVVKDGYQWRKYGQKVTRDNPSPRAYFKCSFSPCCPVKKKVQKSADDPTILVATYEGEHNHKSPSKSYSSHSPSVVPAPISYTPPKPSPPTVTLDLMTNGAKEDDRDAIHKVLVQHMASSLTRDPNFTAALAAAISGRFNPSHIQKW